jgi:hypothetical protein
MAFAHRAAAAGVDAQDAVGIGGDPDLAIAHLDDGAHGVARQEILARLDHRPALHLLARNHVGAPHARPDPDLTPAVFHQVQHRGRVAAGRQCHGDEAVVCRRAAPQAPLRADP